MIVWLASYPRSGNTFFRVVLKHAFNIETYSIYNDKQGIGADESTSRLVGHKMLPESFSIEAARGSDEVFYLKTHGMSACVKDTDKVVYLYRDGRESSLSYMKHLKDFSGQDVALEDVITGAVGFGRWCDHVADWFSLGDTPVLKVKFEDLTADPIHAIGEISTFFDIDILSKEIPNFSQLNAVNPKFFRSGKRNSWRDIYSEHEVQLFDSIHAEQLSKLGYK